MTNEAGLEFEDKQQQNAEALEALEKSYLDCGCMPCDRACRERKELISDLFKDVRATLEQPTQAPEVVSVQNFDFEIETIINQTHDIDIKDWDYARNIRDHIADRYPNGVKIVRA